MNAWYKSSFARGAAVVAAAALAVTGVAAPASAQSSDRDLMFAIDTTGSMAGHIDQTKMAVDDLATDLASSSSGTRVGLVEYRDNGDAFQAQTVTPLTFDVTDFSADLAALTVGGGGDTPESVYSGIARSLCEAWSPDAVKAVIAIGDAPAKDPEPVTGLTADRIIALANGTATDNPYCPGSAAKAVGPYAAAPTAAAVGGVKVFVLSDNTELIDQLQRIADETGGKAVPVDDVSEIGDAIKDTVGTIDEEAAAGGGLLGSLEGSLENLFGS